MYPSKHLFFFSFDERLSHVWSYVLESKLDLDEVVCPQSVHLNGVYNNLVAFRKVFGV